jgi:hypothetical protein
MMFIISFVFPIVLYMDASNHLVNSEVRHDRSHCNPFYFVSLEPDQEALVVW